MILNTEIKIKINEHKRRKWLEFLDGIDLKSGARRLWSTVKALSGCIRAPDNQPVSFGGETVWDPKKSAELFNKQYTPGSHTTDPQQRVIVRRLKKLRVEEVSVTVKDVENAIKSTKSSKALGPDGIAPIHLKHLGPLGLHFLTEVINLYLKTHKTPSM